MTLSGWARFPEINAEVHCPRNQEELLTLVQNGQAIARGNGRAYGDSAISSSNTIHMKHFNRMLAFNDVSGQLIAESGVLLADIIETLLPLGWFPYVTPGTKYVTLGGMIAADIHGKNHHKDGSCGKFVDWLEILDADGKVRRCSRSENTELFSWTVGGMGLTGPILRAAVRLRSVTSAWITQCTYPATDIDHAIELFETNLTSSYSVAWIDCLQSGNHLGRSIVFLGEHAEWTELPNSLRNHPFKTETKRKLKIPMDMPICTLNGYSVRAFNACYYWLNRKKSQNQLISLDSFFYPLDAILGWNRLYGRRGFAQFQCVIPLQNARAGLRAILHTTSNTGVGSFLAVLKRFGEQNSKFSFPMKGYTLALDFPISQKTFALMDRLDKILLEYGGRIYLAKDSRIEGRVFDLLDKRTSSFRDYRTKTNIRNAYESNQSRRLKL
tara:strand:- start:1984 stop:3306 length:1323 start_codon:yes stop_codon:yes gene_type:complete